MRPLRRRPSGRVASLLVADPHAVVREGLRALAAPLPGLVVVGEAASGAEALALTGRRRPGLVLAAARLPDLDGAELTRRLAAAHPGVGVALLGAAPDAGVVAEALAAGARGALAREADAEELVAALRALARGERFLDARLALPAAATPAPAGAPGGLSPREREVLALLAAGRSNQEIASRLVLSVETVKTHVTHVLAKLGAERRAQAVTLAFRAGLLD